jgi:hypothetical protein
MAKRKAKMLKSVLDQTLPERAAAIMSKPPSPDANDFERLCRAILSDFLDGPVEPQKSDPPGDR